MGPKHIESQYTWPNSNGMNTSRGWEKKDYPSKSLTGHHRGEEKSDPEKAGEKASLHKFEEEKWKKTCG